MPSEKIATLCVLHLMKHLFRSFITDVRKIKDDENLVNDKETDINSNDVKLTAIQLFDELGKLFDKELK
jgi:hypothetical protein